MILLKPALSMTESPAFLGERSRPKEREDLERENWTFLRNLASERLATLTVLIGRRPSEEVCK